MTDRDDERLMRLALAEADAAGAAGDVPVGAILVDRRGEVVSTGRNRREVRSDPTAHAEMETLREAARVLGRWRLDDLTMIVTLEPCVMCAGGLVHARIRRLVFGCLDEKAGAVTSLFAIGRDPRLNHRFAIRGGVLADDCAARLQTFFGGLRGGHQRGRGRR